MAGEEAGQHAYFVSLEMYFGYQVSLIGYESA